MRFGNSLYIIKINGIEGKVIEVGLKVTKLVDVANGNKYVISNRNIAEALTVSNEMYMYVPLRYEEKIEDVEKLFEEIVKEILKIENIIPQHISTVIEKLEEMGVKIKEQTPNADGKTKNHTVIDYFNDTAQEFEERLMTLLAEIFSPDVPFSQTSCQKHCAYCNFRKICGRKVEKY